jgi:hypothetical protein
MDWFGKTHPVERLVEWAAPLVLAIAAAWAAHLVRMPVIAVAASAAAALAGGLLAMRMAGSAPSATEPSFEPAPLESVDELDELSLDDPSAELLLDDPLVEPEAGSRVVKLFARQDPTPGELVLRISDYLSEQGQVATDAVGPVEPQQVDASAALHGALANIRASLR